jgi:hypothetical protein
MAFYKHEISAMLDQLTEEQQQKVLEYMHLLDGSEGKQKLGKK